MKHLFLTMQEYENMPLYAINDTLYNRIESAFIKAIGERTAKKFLAKYMEKSVKTLSCQSYVDILSLITIY